MLPFSQVTTLSINETVCSYISFESGWLKKLYINIIWICIKYHVRFCVLYLTGVSQDHYDWGLRAIKSVLVVAGSLKRGDPERPEDQVLMRALRDFNVPKIVTDDMPVFMGLIGDLFPALDVPRKRDLDFEKFVKQSVLDLKLQAEDNFVLKVRDPVHSFVVEHRFSISDIGVRLF